MKLRRHNAKDLNVSHQFIRISKYFEGCLLYAYDDKDPMRRKIKEGDVCKGTLTIGHGHTRTVRPGMTITQEEADALFLKDIAESVNLARAVLRVPVTQYEFDAFVDIIFNVGAGREAGYRAADDPGKDGIITLKSGMPSTLLRKLNAKDYRGAQREFLKWWRTEGAELGLFRRRVANALLFGGLDWGDIPQTIFEAGALTLEEAEAKSPGPLPLPAIDQVEEKPVEKKPIDPDSKKPEELGLDPDAPLKPLDKSERARNYAAQREAKIWAILSGMGAGLVTIFDRFIGLVDKYFNQFLIIFSIIAVLAGIRYTLGYIGRKRGERKGRQGLY